jgi:hypothetical protein
LVAHNFGVARNSEAVLPALADNPVEADIPAEGPARWVAVVVLVAATAARHTAVDSPATARAERTRRDCPRSAMLGLEFAVVTPGRDLYLASHCGRYCRFCPGTMPAMLVLQWVPDRAVQFPSGWK